MVLHSSYLTTADAEDVLSISVPHLKPKAGHWQMVGRQNTVF